MKVVIVGRTRMSGSARCIGGLAEDGTSLRLMLKSGQWDDTSPLHIGSVWDLHFEKHPHILPPHVEDVIVSKGEKVGEIENLRDFIVANASVWRGGIDAIFDGKLGFTGAGNGYVNELRGSPAVSTGFWIPDRDLTLRTDGKHYDYPRFWQKRGLSYVGEPAAANSIRAGTLVRVSLARWWKPEDVDIEVRCYAQLSGWY